MMKSAFKKWALFFAVGLGLPLMLLSVYSLFEQNKKTLPYFGDTVDDAKTHYRVEKFSFIDQDSTIFNSSSLLKNKITVIHSFFTSCSSICPKMIRNDISILKEFKNEDELMILSFTVDPERDTPKHLKEYSMSLGLDLDRWKLLTGNKKDLYLFARKSLFIAVADGNGKGDDDDFIHSEQAILLDKEQHIRGYFDLSSQEGMKSLINAIRILKNKSI